jgi:hypothetical protein
MRDSSARRTPLRKRKVSQWILWWQEVIRMDRMAILIYVRVRARLRMVTKTKTKTNIESMSSI